MRVTDLDKFCLEQIWWPYQSYHSDDKGRLKSSPFSLDETAEMLRQDTPWAQAVLGRLKAIGVTFPSYVKHGLVDAVKEGTRST